MKDKQYNGQKKGQKDKQWSTKHYTENKDWATQTQQKNPGMNSAAP
jgi:hypothetical protein